MFHEDKEGDGQWLGDSNDRQDMVLPLLVRNGNTIVKYFKIGAQLVNFWSCMTDREALEQSVYPQPVIEVVGRCFHESSNILPDIVQWQLCHFWKSSNGHRHTACTERQTSSQGRGHKYPLDSLLSQIQFLQDNKSLQATVQTQYNA